MSLPDKWRAAKAEDYVEPLRGMILRGEVDPPDEMVIEDMPSSHSERPRHIWETQHFGPYGGSHICARCFKRRPWWQFWTGRCDRV